jgi:hypothetical protein
MNKILVALAFLLVNTTAVAGLVSVNTSNYIRESGSAVTETLSITLENEGEIRISNVNLQDDAIEVAASTEVYLNGQPVLNPFYLPPGGSVVFPLEAGAHELEVTVLGKPGGGIAVSFYEDKPDAPVQGKGWELLDDGTVLHRKTGLIWHRKLASPGLAASTTGIGRWERGRVWADLNVQLFPSPYKLSISQYIQNLNAGVYGEDIVNGNAGYSDWRAPTIHELMDATDIRSIPPLANSDGNVDYALYNGRVQIGMQPGEPLYFCVNSVEQPEHVDIGVPLCPNEWFVEFLITNLPAPDPWAVDGRHFTAIDFYYDYLYVFGASGSVWPVRGGPAN